MPDYYCEKCRRTMRGEQFYTSRNFEKYPNDGKLKQCKQCITMHVDNWDPETYKWILEEIDVPYVPDEWNKLLAKYGKDRSKLTGTSILGRYLSVMKLVQYKEYFWKDTDYLQELQKTRIEETMRRQGYTRQQIDEVIATATFSAPTPPPPLPDPEEPAPELPAMDTLGQQIEREMVADLTEDDRRYLCLKWGKTYRPDEWIRLEELYSQMLGSYDIQQAGDINTLKLACKSSLKANQLLDLGDGSQKLA